MMVNQITGLKQGPCCTSVMYNKSIQIPKPISAWQVKSITILQYMHIESNLSYVTSRVRVMVFNATFNNISVIS
jgi:hypothetical protein